MRGRNMRRLEGNILSASNKHCIRKEVVLFTLLERVCSFPRGPLEAGYGYMDRGVRGAVEAWSEVLPWVPWVVQAGALSYFQWRRRVICRRESGRDCVSE